jgi:diguanylate cyclase (GGDEF)-like protein/PAS domain S-box-containing protein
MAKDRYKEIIHASRDFITLISRDYVYDFVNQSYSDQIGLSPEQILGRSVPDVWGSERFEKRIKKKLDECFQGNECHEIDQFKFGDSLKYIHVSYYPFFDGDEITHAMVYSHDISMIKKLESKLLDFEFKDPTTGLFNRKSFNIVLDMELEKARRSARDGLRAVLFISLRNLSQINEHYGYELGDLLMESTALRIKEALRASDYVFRFDGKEFATILTTIKNPDDLPVVVEKIQENTNLPYNYKGAVIYIHCNVGAAIFPNDGDTREGISSCAIAAVNEANEKNESLVIFDKELHDKALYKARLRSDLRKAFVEKQFETYFQPIVDTEGNIRGAEALIRWKHPELGYISPANFIPIAESSGDVVMIDRWILFQVCRFIKQWESFLGDRYISINLSSREFCGPTLVEDLRGIIALEGISPASLKLEITESQSMENLETVIERITGLAQIGVDVLIDDFGAGYSSLAYLKQLPARTFKIDKSFVDRIAEDEEDRSFIIGLIALINSKNRTVLVEGVADRDQYEILRNLKVDYMQGFYFSKPRPADDFRRLLELGLPLPEEGA